MEYSKFVEEMKSKDGTYLLPFPMFDYLIDNGFFNAPASTRHHGDYAGGLYEHSLAVKNRLVEMTEKMGLKWENERSPYIVGMFHDLCKIDRYKHPLLDNIQPLNGEVTKIYDESKWEHNNDTLLKGHGEKSVMLLSQFMTLTEEEIMCIRYHMGAYNTDDWEGYDRAIRKYPNVLWTHTADMLASKVDGV